MQILVTGASGFVGKHIIDALHSSGDFQVKAIVRSHEKHASSESVDYYQIKSIDSQTEWKGMLNNIDIVVHCAARAHVLNEHCSNPLNEFREVNVQGTINLAKACIEAGVKRFIFISSIGVCGSTTDTEHFNEQTKPCPSTAYAISKLEAEDELERISAQPNSLEIVIIRPPLVYAENAPGNFGKLLSIVHGGIPLPFLLLNNKRSFIAIENLVDFVVTCIAHPKAANQTFVISDDCDLSTPELISLLASGMGKKISLIPIPLFILKFAAKLLKKTSTYEQLCGSLQIDISKAKKMLDWQPPVNSKAALVKAGNIYKKANTH